MPVGASKVTEEMVACLLVNERKINLFKIISICKTLWVNLDKAYVLISALKINKKSK